ncbi:MAG: hypothetical protein EDR02_00445 [Actinobacteria bacterium]|nr:MAG: hypothetical protein EDR02_00445 [Actinomycetota bacterium]RIK05809.1 MAG: hypothetical protein DCC48_09070 [Acidobacteriota bacterium]
MLRTDLRSTGSEDEMVTLLMLLGISYLGLSALSSLLIARFLSAGRPPQRPLPQRGPRAEVGRAA